MDRGDFEVDFQEPGTCNTPLFAAISYFREDVAVELILRGANVDLSDRNGETPLMMACRFNFQSTAHALVQAGADIERAASINPLGYAAHEGHICMVRAMLSWGADPNAVGTMQETARAAAKRRCRHGVVKLLDTSGSILVVRSAEEVRRLSKHSALKLLPKDLCRMVGAILL
jgi:hypothetical protein